MTGPPLPESERALLRAALAGLSALWAVPCDPTQVEALSRYAALLLTWTSRINLTGAHSPKALAEDHFPDAFALAAVLPGAESAVDVGSGGGLPALPLSLLRPQLRVRLVEPIAKKVAFLRTAIRELGLGDRVTVDPRRGEALAGEDPGSFDVALSRATLPPPDWLDLGSLLVRPGGRIFVLASSQLTLQAPGLTQVLSRPYLDGRRWLITFERGVGPSCST